MRIFRETHVVTANEANVLGYFNHDVPVNQNLKLHFVGMYVARQFALCGVDIADPSLTYISLCDGYSSSLDGFKWNGNIEMYMRTLRFKGFYPVENEVWQIWWVVD